MNSGRLLAASLLAILAVGGCASVPPPAATPTAAAPTTAAVDASVRPIDDQPTATAGSANPTAGPTAGPTAEPTASPTPEPTAAPSPRPTPAPPAEVRLMAVGDVMLADMAGQAIRRDGPDAPWLGVVDTFAQADLVFANLECTISERGTAAHKAFTFRAPPAAADSIVAAGIDVVSLANNHAIDYGIPALQDTIAALDERGVRHAGAGENGTEAHAPAIIERNGLRIAFLAYVAALAERTGFATRQWEARNDRPGLALARPAQVALDVAAAREQADVVIVSLHGGREYRNLPVRPQQAVADAALGAGAALVLGHHPHVLQGYARTNNTLVAYSLGNFVFDRFQGRPNDSVILDVTLTAEGVAEVRWIPVLVRNGFPTLAEGNDAARILARVEDLS